ncbi:hypothetical protein DACRYDRAFT_22054 [Dacryopinax primogenitus]|uniref:LIM zinc-binding domain-containing protein n=1 Tax=Dacryopinax primogenitus (strain DJM 731) TaxID=1858805 RepID=M5FWR4_DACPD|nr:uncharacterized protein DACRYDRAFT_22054 [Dacryopinax primogenitus]EJU02396.1 hypothetical protein DACRYDRAFT_22054 [Dacryopinax primogenitus]
MTGEGALADRQDEGGGLVQPSGEEDRTGEQAEGGEKGGMVPTRSQDEDHSGHPYCEMCHVRLHLPKCKGCKKPIREAETAVEVKRGKWHWSCFACETCKKPFADGTFFERQDEAFGDGCYRIPLSNEI